MRTVEKWMKKENGQQEQDEKIRDFVELQADDFLVGGAVLISIGTIITALSLTRVFITRSPQGAEGLVIGNGIESVGNVFQVLGKEKLYSIEPIEPRRTGILGSWLQAIGNAGNALAIQEGIILYRFTFTDEGSRNDTTTNTAMAMNAQQDESASTIENGSTTEQEVQSTPQQEGVEEELKRSIGFDAVSSGIQGVGAYLEGSSTLRLPAFPTQGIEATGDYLTTFGAFLEASGAVLAIHDQELKGVLLQLIGSWIEVAASSLGLYAYTTEASLHKQKNEEKYRYSYSRYTI